MSRSYKKTPIIKEHVKGMKKRANRKIRCSKVCVANGSAYRKVFCSYDISDYSLRTTYTEYRAKDELDPYSESTPQMSYQNWKKEWLSK